MPCLEWSNGGVFRDVLSEEVIKAETKDEQKSRAGCTFSAKGVAHHAKIGKALLLYFKSKACANKG